MELVWHAQDERPATVLEAPLRLAALEETAEPWVAALEVRPL